MIAPEALIELAQQALSRAGEAEADVHLVDHQRGLVRVAIGEIREHVSIAEPEVRVRVARGARVGEARSSALEVDAIVGAIRDAATLAELAPPREGFPGFAKPSEAGTPIEIDRWSSDASSPEARIEAVGPVVDAIRGHGLIAAATVQTIHKSAAVVTTHGLSRGHRAAVAAARVWALETAGKGGAAGFDSALGRTLRDLDMARVAERAIRDARDAKTTRSLPAGTYDVVLEPEAVASVLEWLGYIAFGAPEVEEGSSFLAGRIGEKVTGEGVTLIDDPLSDHPALACASFDREGIARRKVTIVERGVARGVLYDRESARRANAESTGSAADTIFRSISPAAIFMGGGSAESVDELLKLSDRVLHVRRFHYLNGFLEPRRAVMTGLTRDGTFLVEKGQRVASVGNLRFTDSIVEAFARIGGATRNVSAVPAHYEDDHCIRAPALFIRGLNFSSGTPIHPSEAP